MPALLQAFARLVALKRLGILLFVLAATLCAASTASALKPSQTKTRIRGFELAGDNSGGLFGDATRGKHQGNRAALSEVASSSLLAAEGVPALGDLTAAEIEQIQGVVNQAGRPLEVVGSAAQGARRGIGTELPIGKGLGTRSDIDYLIPHGSAPYYEGFYEGLPSLDQGGPIFGVHNPYIGPAVRFEPEAAPFFVPGAQ